jgi:monoamine oxidase
MAASPPRHILIVGAGAAGLIAARELSRAGKRVTILEAQRRCGGRIYPLPVAEFGYPAEGGAEFVHGEAPVTHALLGEAGLAFAPMAGRRRTVRNGVVAQDEDEDAAAPHEDRLYRALAELEDDLPIAEFLDRHFAGPPYEKLRRSIKRMVEGYDAADPARASTLALREEWMGRGLGRQGRIEGGYGGLIEFLATKCAEQGASIHLGTVVSAIEESGGGIIAHGGDGRSWSADAAILAVPLPLLGDIALPPAAREKAAAASAAIGYGNVVKLLLRFRAPWWARIGGGDLSDLSFLFSSAAVPTWWTQRPAEHPVLTGWFAGPKTAQVAPLSEAELVEMGLVSLAQTFDLPPDQLRRELVAARAIDWAKDPFARGAYSYATPETRAAQAVLTKADGGRLFFSGEALYRGRDAGTVEAALASGVETARTILALGS